MPYTENQVRILGLLIGLYGETAGMQTFERLIDLMQPYCHPSISGKIPELSLNLSQRDAILISYGDQVREPGTPPLRTLAEFCNSYLTGLLSGIHILPFYPSSSDDGFSVIDYREVDPALGRWGDIDRLGSNFRLMFDAVINHVSSQSKWFNGFLNNDPRFKDYFIVIDGNPDLSRVVRPRALPLLTSFQTTTTVKRVWTTFSVDQVDLNYSNPQVLLEIIDILLFYTRRGAEFIRLDAIAYLWKEIRTSCIHLPRTHLVVQLLRAVLDECVPHVLLVTETNVPHEENMAYFGDGIHEAQMVYNFALPPLVLHSILTGDARHLTYWAQGLSLPSKQVTYFNFLASHDGIGINPARGLLPEGAVDLLVACTLEHGGLVSYKSNPDGTQSPYELNISYFDALSDPAAKTPIEEQVNRFMAAHGIMLSLVGVPGIYFHSLFGSRSWMEGVTQTGRSRTINRQKLALEELEAELAAPNSLRSRVFEKMRNMLRARISCAAFHPCGEQQVLACGEAIFALLRRPLDRGSAIICLTNISAQAQPASIDLQLALDLDLPSRVGIDRISGREYALGNSDALILNPYQTLWLEISQ